MATFKTRARAVDMLGRQQIADISTAISELFKNAHDAYADHVEVDYFRSDDLLVIRDDGIGMTQDEFENRWLVLGTESKIDTESHNQAFKPADKPARAIMGEKGIGRLAIALLGPQVLVLTRPKRNDVLGDLTMCFIHWGLFELPGLNLDDLDFPIHSMDGGRVPNEHQIGKLLTEFRTLISRLQKQYPRQSFSRILTDIDNLRIDADNLNTFLGGLSLEKSGGGTHFYVAPANKEIRSEIERERDTESKEFSKSLLGFSNSLFCGISRPPIQTAFRYWKTDQNPEELIGEGEFFTKQDLEQSDHYISGHINEYGQFRGQVSVFGKKYPDHVIAWPRGGGVATLCGPFHIEFAYLQGAQRESAADPQDFNRINRKLLQIGGLYVYRDNIRILPYGNSDVDWVDIELRRNKGLTYYFFSYRRIYGAVCLTRKDNGELHEKAGREGFQRGKAYRQLKDILENIFLQLAADFFREGADYGDHYRETKQDLERQELARRKREKQVGTKRKNLGVQLGAFFNNVSQRIPDGELETLRSQVRHRMENAAKLSNPDESAEELLSIESDANKRLEAIRTSYLISKPRGVGLNKQLTRDWNAYLSERDRLETQLFEPFSTEVANTLGHMANQARVYIDQRRRLKELIQLTIASNESAVKSEASQVQTSAGDTRRIAINTARKAIQEFKDVVREVEADFSEQDLTVVSQEDVERLRHNYIRRIGDIGKRNADSLGRIREMLTSISENIVQSSDVDHLDIVESLDSELQSYKDQADTDAELVQLGLAVAVINHEFEAAIKSIRTTIRELGSWAKLNDELTPLYRDIRANFEHLDEHLNLFTPLQRRLYRNRVSIKGTEINHYLRTLFSARFKRHQVEMHASQSFLDSSVNSFPSVIYPVFVNIIDNAIFWLTSISEQKIISLDYNNGKYLIHNNGPEIPVRDREAIFEQGFTRKPLGRGLGLFISRKTLAKEGMDIDIAPAGPPSAGVTFEIITTKDIVSEPATN